QVLLDLAAQGPRELVDELQPLGSLLFRNALGLEMGQDLGERQLLTVAGEHERAHLLAVPLIAHGYDGRFLYLRMTSEDLLDLAGGDVLPAADDDVLLSVGDHEVTVLGEPPDVAGVEPSALVERPRVQRRAHVAAE